MRHEGGGKHGASAITPVYRPLPERRGLWAWVTRLTLLINQTDQVRHFLGCEDALAL